MDAVAVELAPTDTDADEVVLMDLVFEGEAFEDGVTLAVTVQPLEGDRVPVNEMDWVRVPDVATRRLRCAWGGTMGSAALFNRAPAQYTTGSPVRPTPPLHLIMTRPLWLPSITDFRW